MSKRPQKDQLDRSGKRVYIGRQSVQAQPPSAPAPAPAPAPARNRVRSGIYQSLNPALELFGEEGLDYTKPPEVTARELYNLDVRQQGGASNALVTSSRNIGRTGFQNLVGDEEYRRVRAARAGIAGSPTMRSVPTILQQTPSPELARRIPQSTESSASYASNASSMSELGAFGKLDLDEEDMNGEGFKKLKKGSPAMKAHMAKLRAMRKKK